MERGTGRHFGLGLQFPSLRSCAGSLRICGRPFFEGSFTCD